MDTLQNHPTEDDSLSSFEPGLAVGQRRSTTSRARATTSHSSEATADADPNVKTIDEIPSGGALIPPELFRSIIWWIAHNDDMGEVLNSHISSLAGGLFDWDLYLEEQERVKPLSNLKGCSLVCRYWANRARVFLFKDRHLHINSLEMAQAFRKYTVEGCRELVPLWTLIRDVQVTVEYSKASRSYLDIVYTPQIRDKLLSLTMGITLQGPISNPTSRRAFDSPHWGLSNLVTPPPSATPYTEITIEDVHFSSLKYLLRYFKHFSAATVSRLDRITWDDKTSEYLTHLPKPAARYRPFISVSSTGCTNGLFLCLQLTMMFPDCSLRAVADEDYRWAMAIMNLLGEFYRRRDYNEQTTLAQVCYVASSGELCTSTLAKHDSGSHDPSMLLPFSSQGSSTSNIPKTFRISFTIPTSTNFALKFALCTIVFYVDPQWTPADSNEKARMRRSPPPLPRIRGILVSISDYTPITEDRYADFTFPDLTLLRTNIEEHCSLRVVAFVFDSRELLLAAAKQYPSLLEPIPHGKTYVFACKTSARRLWDQRSRRLYDTYTEINRTSMEPTGTVWTAEEASAIVPDILNSGGS